jgi:hypothetical protein
VLFVCPLYSLQILFISREADTTRAQRDSRSGMGGGGGAQESTVVVLLEAEGDTEAGIKGTLGEGEVAAVVRSTSPRC